MIRSVKQEDAAAIAAIYNEYVLHTTVSFETEAVSEEEMRERIRRFSAGYPYIVEESDGEIRGYCYAHAWKERAAYCRSWETTIYLRSDCVGLGIGSRLMQELIARCRAAGCHTLIACITGDNTTSRMFHEQLGFSSVSRFREVGVKFGRFLDVEDYQLIL